MSQWAGRLRHLRILTLSLQAVDGVAMVCSQAGIPGPLWRVSGLHNSSSQQTKKQHATDCTVITFNHHWLDLLSKLLVRHADLSPWIWPKNDHERSHIAGAAPDGPGTVFQPGDGHVPGLGN